MDTINARIAWLIENNNRTTTKSGFAKIINISQPFISQICAGTKMPSDRTIADICREFGVREAWLRDGEEPMKYPDADPGMEVISDLMHDVDDPVAAAIKSIYKIYKELPPDDQEVLRRFIRSLRDQK